MGKDAACLGLIHSWGWAPAPPPRPQSVHPPPSPHWALPPSHWTVLRNKLLSYSSQDTLHWEGLPGSGLGLGSPPSSGRRLPGQGRALRGNLAVRGLKAARRVENVPSLRKTQEIHRREPKFPACFLNTLFV